MTIIGKLFVKPIDKDEGLGMLSKLVQEALANDPHTNRVRVDNDYSFALYREGYVGKTSAARRAEDIAHFEETVTVAEGTVIHLFGSKANGIFMPLAHRLYFNVKDNSLSIDLKTGVVRRSRFPIANDILPPTIKVIFNH